MSSVSRGSQRPTRSDYKYWKSYHTRWSDNDQYSHVNNAVYYHLIDSIINTFLAERCGCLPSLPSPSDSSISVTETLSPIGLVVSSHCDFFSPLSFPETIELGLRVTRLGTSSVTYEVGFFSSVDSKALKAVGGYTHVFVDRNDRRPVKAMGRHLRRGLESLADEGLDRSSRPDRDIAKL